MKTLWIAALALLAGCGGTTETVEAPPVAEAPAALSPAPERLGDSAVFAGRHEPIEANLFIAPRGELLYIAWALPRDLMPLAVLDDPRQIEPFLVNSAAALCVEEQGRATAEQTGCMVHLLRLESNDEYTKSAAGGFGTVGKMQIPLATVKTFGLAILDQPRSDVRALFSRIDLDLAGFDLAKAKQAAQ